MDPTAAERLFRHRVLALLSAEGLLSQERMRVLAFILDPGVVRKILAHLAAKGGGSGRAPPLAQPSSSFLA